MKKPQLLPEPKKVNLTKGTLSLPSKGLIAIQGFDGDKGIDIAELLTADLLKKWEVTAIAKGVRPPKESIVLKKSKTKLKSPDAYKLSVTAKGITVEADADSGLFYGVQTLIQLLKQYGDKLPCLKINDWPDFKYRAVYLDMTRGRVPHVSEVCRFIENLAQFKINHFQLYIEHTFKFRRHPKIGRGASPYSAEDMIHIDRFAKKHFVDFCPSLASFGHVAKILTIPEYRFMAEDLGIGKYHPEADKGIRIKGWTLSPAVPAIYPFITELFEDFLPSFSSKMFNICCDETWDLGMGQAYEICKKKGKGRVYLDHLNKIRTISKKLGKKVMFWGDIILHHPELIPEIPKDVIVLNWGYEYDHDFKSQYKFQKAGLEHWVCPGTSAWGTLFPRINNACENIAKFAAVGKKSGATGLLNTDWGDGGHYNFTDFSWHGYLFGAEQSWNVKADQKSFDKRFSLLFFGDESGELAKAIRLLGSTTQGAFQGRNHSKQMSSLFSPFDKGPKVSEAEAQAAIKKILTARKVFESFRKKGVARDIMEQYIFAADTMKCAAEKVLANHAFKKSPKRGTAKRKACIAEMKKLMRRFEKIWMKNNFRSEIRITLGRYKTGMKIE